MEKSEPRKALWNNPTKPVGVDVEQSHFSEQTQLNRKVPSNVSMVNINPSNNIEFWVIKSLCTENSIVRTNINANPI